MFAHTIQTLLDRAHRTLNEHRLQHLLSVTHTAMVLAGLHGLGVERAAVAGLLHDLSKPIDPETIQQELTAWGVAIPEVDREYPRTWHGQHAAEWARRQLGIDDPQILEAVTLHTTADAGVGPLTMALFVADYAEPLRRFEDAPLIMDAVRRDLEAGFRLALKLKTSHVAGKGRPLHSRARRALEHYPCPSIL